MHKNNLHKKGYNFKSLIVANPTLQTFVFKNQYGTQTIDFANPYAVKALNKALLIKYYSINYWEFPDGFLCPPVPGRSDYIHHINDLLTESGLNKNASVLDIGTGANCIYPLLGNAIYNWGFTGSECNKKAFVSAEGIIEQNNLFEVISLRFQSNKEDILTGIIRPTDAFSVSICNPPFYKDEKEALKATTRKLKGLRKNTDKAVRNFAGQPDELWYKGGEKAFLHTYLYQSSLCKTNCFWYTSLVSNKDNIKSIQTSLKKLGATKVKVLNMHQGNKISRVVAWTFLTAEEQKDWINN